MNRQSVLASAEERFPNAGWVIVEGHHDERFLVSSRGARTTVWDRDQAASVAAEVVSAAAVRLSRVTTAAARLGRSSRAYVAVQAADGSWAVADAFVRFDEMGTLPFDPPGLNA